LLNLTERPIGSSAGKYFLAADSLMSPDGDFAAGSSLDFLADGYPVGLITEVDDRQQHAVFEFAEGLLSHLARQTHI
jgi:hypothetical protein